MNRLIALWALLAVATGAQAQSSVTLYGSLDVALTSAHQGSGTTTPGGSARTALGASTITRVDSNVGPGSRFGFRGNEDLGNGLSANFVMESGFAVDTGAQTQGGLMFGRQAWVGLSSTSGWSLSAGRQYSPMGIAAGSSDALGLFWGNASGQMGFGLYESVAAAPGGGSFGSVNRVDNSLLGTYSSGNFVGRLMVSAGNENTRGTGKVFNPSLSYTSDKFQINSSYARVRQNAEQITATADPESLSMWHLGGNYNFGPVKLFAGYFLLNAPKNRTNLSAAFNASPFTYSWNKTWSTWLGAKMPIGVDVLTVQLTRTNFDYLAGPQGKATLLGTVYEHNLSKRTAMYASYGQVNNNAFSNAALFATIAAIAPNGFGAHHRAFSVGLKHSF